MKNTNNKIVVNAVIIAILAGGFAFLCIIQPQTGTGAGQKQSQEAVENFSTLSSDKLASMLEKKDFFFVNVHVPYEGEIKNTDAFIPYDKIADNLDKLPKDKNARIVLYCRSGRMSEIAAKELVRLGYTNVSHLGGGMIEWEKNVYDIIKNR